MLINVCSTSGKFYLIETCDRPITQLRYRIEIVYNNTLITMMGILDANSPPEQRRNVAAQIR
jgi:hypothetical protein